MSFKRMSDFCCSSRVLFLRVPLIGGYVGFVAVSQQGAIMHSDSAILNPFKISISNGLGRRHVPNLVRSGRKQP